MQAQAPGSRVKLNDEGYNSTDFSMAVSSGMNSFLDENNGVKQILPELHLLTQRADRHAR